MTELTIQFNYVQDCVVLLREDFLKYTCVILPKEKDILLEFMTEFDVTLVTEKISIDEDNRKFTGTYIDTSDLAKLSKRSVNTVNALLDRIVDKMNDRFERIERDLNQRLSKQFDGKQLNCFGDPTYKMWVSDDGYVYLCGKLTIVYGIKNEFSDNVFDCVQAIVDDVMTGNVYKTTDITYRVTF